MYFAVFAHVDGLKVIIEMVLRTIITDGLCARRGGTGEDSHPEEGRILGIAQGEDLTMIVHRLMNFDNIVS